MKIVAVVVTYNRLSLLKECIAGIKAQTHKPDAILVVNNSSTDGTTEWLQLQTGIITHQQPNKGGAWGFSTGIKEAYKLGADWVWVMDDDTIPSATALEKLVKGIENVREEKDEFGFFASKVIWTDGSIHNANTVVNDVINKWQSSAEHYQQKGVQLVPYCTFVSVIVSRKAIKTAGLPIKEFFIWYDDIEYTHRITRAGYAGGFVADSIVLHKTPGNHNNDMFTDTVCKLWKYKHGLRNQLYYRRHTKSYGSYLRHAAKRLIIMPIHILKKRKDGRWPFIKMVWQSSFAALRFNPPIEFVED